MFNNCQDAMRIGKKYGYPDLFITMRCNLSWQEICRINNPRNLKVKDRPDISCIRTVNDLMDMTDDESKNLCLIEIEKILNSNARSLRDYQSMPYSEVSDVFFFQNKLIEEELTYDTNELTHTNLYTEQKMTHEQMLVFDEILNAVIADLVVFTSFMRMSKRKIILNFESSRIAFLLLPGGRTAHSKFSIPITITDKSTCNIKHGSLKAELLIQNSLIIWDEVPMLNKMCFEALDRTLRDLMSVADQHKTHQPFGGKVVVLGGDFRQILPNSDDSERE
ncbi:uncharacterized protein [Arachis hypogaea]|uniref:uncharacterized protein n=1 Tax=Arachis hypogaea TaxID=3818 RepID=UPI003B21A2D0